MPIVGDPTRGLSEQGLKAETRKEHLRLRHQLAKGKSMLKFMTCERLPRSFCVTEYMVLEKGRERGERPLEKRGAGL